MNPRETTHVLNRLLHILDRSLPMYLREAKPYVSPDQAPIGNAITALAADHAHYAAQIAEAILLEGGRPDSGVFPTEFSAANDLAIDFLLVEVLKRHRVATAEIENLAGELACSMIHAPLAREVLGNAKGHLEILERLSPSR